LRLAGLGVTIVALLVVLSGHGASRAEAPNLLERLYVTNEWDGTVTAIDTLTNQVLATIPVGKRPHHLAITRDGRYVFVGTSGEKFMPVIDALTLKVVEQIPVVDGPAHPALSRNGKWVGVDNAASHFVSLIDAATFTNLGNFEATKGKRSKFEHPAWAPGDRYFFAGNIGGQTVVQVDPIGRKIVKEYFARSSHYLAVHPKKPEVWSSSETTRDGEKAVAVVNWETQEVRYIDLPTNPKTPSDLHHAVFSCDGKYYYVADRGYFRTTREVYVIDTDTYEVAKVIREAKAPQHPVRSPDCRSIIVGGNKENFVFKIDTRTNEVTGRISTAGPQGIKNPYQEHLFFHPSGKYLYVVNAGDQYVAVIDWASEKVIATVPVGKRPHWVGMPDDPEKQW